MKIGGNLRLHLTAHEVEKRVHDGKPVGATTCRLQRLARGVTRLCRLQYFSFRWLEE